MTLDPENSWRVLPRKLTWRLLSFQNRQTLRNLHLRKPDQRVRYARLRARFSGLYRDFAARDHPGAITPLWTARNARVDRAFQPYPPFGFLRDPDVSYAMFVNQGGVTLREELALLEQRYPCQWPCESPRSWPRKVPTPSLLTI